MLAEHEQMTADDTDPGPKSRRGEALRTCIVTRKEGSPADLIRFVVDPDGMVIPDLKAVLPGRGAWVEAKATTLALAMKKKAFTRAFKREVKVDPELVARVEALIQAQTLSALSLANKAGQILTGYDTIERSFAKGKIVALFHATDAASDGIRKLSAASRRILGEDAERIARCQIFSSDQMDLALGKQNVIHAALLAGPAAQNFLARCAMMERFNPSSSPEGKDKPDARPAQGAGNEDE